MTTSGTNHRWLDWRRANGALKTRECRDFLQRLEEPARLELPPLRPGRPRGAATAIPRTRQGDAPAPLDCALDWVQPVRLKPIAQPAEQRLWRELVGVTTIWAIEPPTVLRYVT